MCELTTLQAEK